MTRISRKKAKILREECVSCGCCENECPVSAVSIYRGLYAEVDGERCIGCGRCELACPASVIDMVERGADA